MNFFLYFLLIFLSLFQDLPLGNSIGLYGQCLCGPLSLIVSPFAIWSLSQKPAKKNPSFFLSIYFIAFILINLFFSFYYGGESLGGEDSFVKTIKGLLYIVSIIIYCFDLYCFSKKLSKKQIFMPFVFCFFFLFLILLVEINHPEYLDVFHCSLNYNRIRLLTSESSQTSSQIIIFSAFTIFYFYRIKRKPFMVLLSLLFFALLIFYSSSKSLIAVVLLSSLFALFNFKSRYKFLLTIGVLFIGCILFPRLLSYFNSDLSNYTSFSTRFFTIICALVIMIKYPFGTGTAAYVKILPEEMKQLLPWFSSSFPKFNISEIVTLISSKTDSAIAVKSGLFQLGIQIGIIGFLILISFGLKLFKKVKKSNSFFIAFTFWALILLSLFIGFEIKYDYYCGFFVFTALLKLKNPSFRKSASYKIAIVKRKNLIITSD